jgi:methylmalonyl-CoA mutase
MSYKIRILTATSLFDGHDASINIMRRILQSNGAEVIHLGHNRSAKEIVKAAIEEDVQALAITSYQGGHIEFFKYIKDLLFKNKASHIKIFGGGGGTILPSEIKELEDYGITKIYSSDDGRKMGLEGMILDLLSKSNFDNGYSTLNDSSSFIRTISTVISEYEKDNFITHPNLKKTEKKIPVIGITGTGGAGKSSITDELVRRFNFNFPDLKICILAIDPTKRKTGGALLGDRIRMNSIFKETIYMRSLATREVNRSVSNSIQSIIELCRKSFDLVFVETAGIGQADSSISDLVDYSIYAMTPEFGASTQLEKIDMLDFANLVIINKSDRFGALDARNSVAKQYQRNHKLFDKNLEELPLFNTIASRFNDSGMNQVFEFLWKDLPFDFSKDNSILKNSSDTIATTIKIENPFYLKEIMNTIQEYNRKVESEAILCSELYQLQGVYKQTDLSKELKNELEKLIQNKKSKINEESLELLNNLEEKISLYKSEKFTYQVRDKKIQIDNFVNSLSNLKIPKISTPRLSDYGDRLKFMMQENFPGEFPFTSGVFPFKRTEEDPARMFAGEGGPERTNKRFHYISQGSKAIRLSTAFDSVTLYGENPASRMDIYGKIGNSGVSIATLDDMKKLYSGFPLSNSNTSVSMTINGPAPILLAFYMNASIDQECEIYIQQNSLTEKVKKFFQEKSIKQPQYNSILPQGHNSLGLLLLGMNGEDILSKEIYENIKTSTLQKIRGTVQADILKEDQAQNTCIFSIDFSLKLMADVQEYFIKHSIKNFYSVSISGYHMAEAGANPITQLAFTLANAFTYVEYYISCGMKVDDFAPNFSFFFSNGMDPEYSVIGRVARRIWAKAMKFKYKASKRSQMLKYHIQTSGRSLHAQEIDFNDIRTTLQALTAIYDNCNSLHTNAFDEAITTPTEDSVRRALAIQLIINKEAGLSKNENPLQGSFIISELTDLVEEAVLNEFQRISERGGVLGAMETMYQRNKIQEESMYYESLKHSGELPLIGVNTFLSSNGSLTSIPSEVIRSTEEEKNIQIENLEYYHKLHSNVYNQSKDKLIHSIQKKENSFEALLDISRFLSLGQITSILYSLGGGYRRNM